MKHRLWTPEEDAVLHEHYPSEDTKPLATLLNRTYGSVLNRAYTLGLKKTKEYLQKNGYRLQKYSAGRKFAKGHIPANKGMRQSEYMTPEAIAKTAVTRFKKGHKSHNTRPDYYESVRKDKYGRAYVFIKSPEHKKMITKQVYLWELHNGSVPKGHNIVFKDGNSLNCVIENLECIGKAENLNRNTLHRYPKEIAELIQLKGAVNRQINKHLKSKHNDGTSN